MGVDVRWIVSPETPSLPLKDPVFGLENFDESVRSPQIAPRLLEFLGGVQLIVLDTYSASIPFMRSLRAASGSALLVIDDFRGRELTGAVDIVLNYGLDALDEDYCWPHCHYLLGPQYCLLRKEFWHLDSHESLPPYTILIPGASDSLGVIPHFIDWWNPKDWGKLIAVAGPLVPHEQLERLSGHARTRHGVEVVHAPPSLPDLIAGATYVICTSSVTAYEALALGKNVAVFQVAENQTRTGQAIETYRLGFNMGQWGTFGGETLEDALFRMKLLGLSGPRTQQWRAVNRRGALKAAKGVLEWFEELTDKPSAQDE